MNERDRVADHMILEFAATVASKGLQPAGIGGGVNHETGKYIELGITFTTLEKIQDVERARILFIETADAFLDFINTREDIREYLDVFPVTILNIDLGIICNNAQPGDIVDISNCFESISYYSESDNPYHDPWNEVLEETFEEAHKQILHHETSEDE